MKYNRRSFLASSATVAMGASMGLQARDSKTTGPLSVNAETPSLKGKKILYTQGGWDGHEPVPSIEVFKPWLIGDTENLSQTEAAARLGMTAGAVKVAIHRLRKSFRDAVQSEIGQTVNSPAEIAEELRYLIEVLS